MPVPVDINEKVLKAFKEAFSDAKDVVWSEIVSVVGRKISIPSSIIDKI